MVYPILRSVDSLLSVINYTLSINFTIEKRTHFFNSAGFFRQNSISLEILQQAAQSKMEFTVKKDLSRDVPMMKKHSYMCENVTCNSICDENRSFKLWCKFIKIWWNFCEFDGCESNCSRMFVKLWWMLIQLWWMFWERFEFFHQIEILLSQLFDDISLKFILKREKKKSREWEENLGPLVPQADTLPLHQICFLLRREERRNHI